MAFIHKPLDEQELGASVWKVVNPDAPAPVRSMAARGLAPLGPRDLVTALYHFWVTNDEEHTDVASKTVETLPAAVLDGALGDHTLPAGAIDFLGRKLLRNAEALDKIVRHPAVDDETLAAVARVCPEAVCDSLSTNQERWLKFPKVVESLYQNPNCRMSVVHRMLELADREGVEVRLPNMDEIRKAMAEDGAPEEDRDAIFQRIAAVNLSGTQQREVDAMVGAAAADELDLDQLGEDVSEDFDMDEFMSATTADEGLSLPLEDDQPVDRRRASEQQPVSKEGRLVQIMQMRPIEKIRLALLGGSFERTILIRDSNKAVAITAIKSPKVKEMEVAAYAGNKALSHDVLRYIASQRHWTKLYDVKLKLVQNPKTPMSSSMSFLGHLHAHDLRKLARSKSIPSALAQAAKRKIAPKR